MTGLAVGFGTPFQEQIDYLRQKLNLPTERWDDIKGRAHDRTFVVAGAAKADLLNDLHQAVNQNAESGGGRLQGFRQDFKAIVAKNGWTGWTGEGTPAGEAWRTRVIYQTNMATSYAAGRWQQLTHPDSVAAMPYWRYIHADGVLHPRPLHLARHGLTLPWDHPFWQTHFAPNGWGCHCRIEGVTRREGEASAAAGLSEPPAGWDTVDPKTGAPVGIDKGWGYAPGASVDKSMQSFIDDKLLALDAPIGAQMAQALEPVLQKERLAAWQQLFDTTLESRQARGQAVLVHALVPQVVDFMASRQVLLDNAAVWMRDTELLHALRPSKVGRLAALPQELLRDLPDMMNRAAIYWDSESGELLYVVDVGDQAGKVVVRMNYNQSGWFDGVRQKLTSNFVITGGVVTAQNLADARYVLIKAAA